MRPSSGARWAGAAAVAGGVLALVLTVPFAASYFLAYPGWDPVPFWLAAVESRLEPIVTGAGVYETYGRIYNLVYVLFLPAAYVVHRLHGASVSRLEWRGFGAVISGLVLTAVGVAGDYWADGLGFILEVPGLLVLGVGMSVYGVALRRSRVLPRWCAWMFLLCGPGMVGSMFLIGHIPSGSTLPIALTWLATGGVLLTGARRRPLDAPG